MLLKTSILVTTLSASTLAYANPASELIYTAIKKNQTAQTQAEWQTSGYTPADIFQKISNAQALCYALAPLQPSDLALFEDELEQAAQKLPCANQLLKRITNFWIRSKRDLQIEYTLKLNDDPTPAKSLPSIEKFIDPALGETIINAGLGPKQIALTFDDGPHPTRTDKILKTLADNGVRATFFSLGDLAKNRPEITLRARANGNTIASHTMSHPRLPYLYEESPEKAYNEIQDARDAIEGLLGEEADFFRFPYGFANQALTDFVKEQKMTSFYWNMDSLDWKIRDPKLLMQNILTVLDREKRGVMLFHDIQEQTTIVLPLLLETLKERGYTTVVFTQHQ